MFLHEYLLFKIRKKKFIQDNALFLDFQVK